MLDRSPIAAIGADRCHQRSDRCHQQSDLTIVPRGIRTLSYKIAAPTVTPFSAGASSTVQSSQKFPHPAVPPGAPPSASSSFTPSRWRPCHQDSCSGTTTVQKIIRGAERQGILYPTFCQGYNLSKTKHTVYCCYKVIYINSARFRLHYYFLNFPPPYAVLSIIIYFTFTLTLYRLCARSAERQYPSGERARVRLGRHWFDSWYLHGT